ncbi:MAG TPA: DUF6531 domain-containing protein, partial [Candidatus Xenobia bacterium]
MSTIQNAFPAPATIDGYQVIAGGCQGGDVIRLANGNLFRGVTLVSVPTIGEPLDLILYYNSTDTVLGAMGNKWRHNYMANLVFMGSPVTAITFTDRDGRQYNWNLSGSVWELNTSTSYFYNATLSPSGSNWLMTFPAGNYYEFDSTGRMIALADTHGNITTLTWTGSNLTQITEPMGRYITLAYSGSLLTSVTDPNTNTAMMSYDTINQNLTAIAMPGGCVETYTYATPSNHLFTTRADANNHAYQY